MSVLSVHDLSFSFSLGASLFQGASFAIEPGDLIGLTGPNGTGKSTLIELLSGDLEPTTGRIVRRRNLRIHKLDRRLAEASSGERTREALAELMRAEADLLLLDEPTNHMDIEGRDWLANWLLRTRATAVIVSHDRDFLNRVTNRTIAIERGSVRCYGGNYDFALHERSLNEDRQWTDYDRNQQRAAAAERAAAQRDQLGAKVAKAPPGARLSKDFYGRKAAKVLRTGRLLRERQSMAPEVKKPWVEQAIPELDFSAVPHSSHLMLDVRELPITGHSVTVTLHRGERWAVTGPNGCGKTTLLKALRDMPPMGSGVRIGYYAQEHEQLDFASTPLAACLEACPDETQVRTMLACLKLRRELVTHPIGTLSLGERSKTALARLLVGGYNLLLLDEPTNHLEMEALEALAEALKQFPGGMFFVSHDRSFIDYVATHKFTFPTHGL